MVADTGPINYLVLIGSIDLLPDLFQNVSIPSAIYGELSSLKAPLAVRQWIAVTPPWLQVHQGTATEDVSLTRLDPGEKAALQLAISINADALLIDDRRGVTAARQKGVRVIGTLGILDLAAQRHLVDLPAAFARLRRTTFRCPDDIMEHLLARHRQELP